IPLVRAFEASWASKMRPAQTPETVTDSSQDEFTAAGLVPRSSRYPGTGYPQVRWPWREVREALVRLSVGAPREQEVALRYVNPRAGHRWGVRRSACAPARPRGPSGGRAAASST